MMQKHINIRPNSKATSDTKQDFICHAARLARQIRPSVLAQMLYAGRSVELAQALAVQNAAREDVRLLMTQAAAFSLSGEQHRDFDVLVAHIAREQRHE